MNNFNEVVPQSEGFNKFHRDRVALGELRNEGAHNANADDGEDQPNN